MKLIRFKCPHCGAELVVAPRFLIKNCKVCGALLDPKVYLQGLDPAALRESPAAAPQKKRAPKASADRKKTPAPAGPPADKKKTSAPAGEPSPAGSEGDKAVSRSGRYYEASPPASRPDRAPVKETKEPAFFTPVGFRTKHPFRITVAVMGYIGILITMADSLSLGLFWLGMVPLWFNWAPLTKVLPIWKIRNKFLRGLALCGATFVWLVVAALVSEYLE